AELWIVSDQLTRADAIVVLGGNSWVRPPVAANLYQSGFADKVLVSRAADEGGMALWQGRSDAERNASELVRLGVPGDAIAKFRHASASTREEAVALSAWARQNAASRFIIPSEIFSARRIRWIFYREFRGQLAEIEVPSFEPPEYSRVNWWETVNGR